jgi:hypothetical protein
MGRASVFVAVVVGGVTMSSACAAAPGLPLHGTTKRGQEWRLRAAKPTADDDVRPSWCLNLGYTTGVVVNGDKYTGGTTTCGRRPARRISGDVVVDCERGSVFVFGAIRDGVGHVRLRAGGDRPGTPRFAKLPSHSGFSGRAFIAVIDTRQLPARLTADGVGQNPVVRIPRRTQVCRPFPGAPEGGEPFLDFESRT